MRSAAAPPKGQLGVQARRRWPSSICGSAWQTWRPAGPAPQSGHSRRLPAQSWSARRPAQRSRRRLRTARAPWTSHPCQAPSLKLQAKPRAGSSPSGPTKSRGEPVCPEAAPVQQGASLLGRRPGAGWTAPQPLNSPQCRCCTASALAACSADVAMQRRRRATQLLWPTRAATCRVWLEAQPDPQHVQQEAAAAAPPPAAAAGRRRGCSTGCCWRPAGQGGHARGGARAQQAGVSLPGTSL